MRLMTAVILFLSGENKLLRLEHLCLRFVCPIYKNDAAKSQHLAGADVLVLGTLNGTIIAGKILIKTQTHIVNTVQREEVCIFYTCCINNFEEIFRHPMQ